MLLKQLFDQETWTYTYLLADPESLAAIIIDPVLERIDRDLQLIAELGLDLIYTLDTHVHADHITGSGELRKRTGALSGISAVSNVACVDRQLKHGDVLRFGRYALNVRSTPGHTDGCLTFVLEADGQYLVFTGDAILVRGCGRTDFQQGDAATLYRAVHEQIFSLPDHAVIYPAHDYRGHTATTVGEEKAHNPRLNMTVTKDEFVTIMDGLGLAYPKRINEALPANMACGLILEDTMQAEEKFKVIDPDQINDFSGGLVVDVRRQEEFEGKLGHLPGAILTPLPELQKKAASWQRNVPVLVVCHSGRRASQGCSMLAQMGFTDITHLQGGMMAWCEWAEATQ